MAGQQPGAAKVLHRHRLRRSFCRRRQYRRTLYDGARDAQKLYDENKYSDAEMLRNMLLRLKKKEKLRNLAVKCFIFNDDPVLFELLLDTIRGLGSLVYLDLTGCYFPTNSLPI